MASPILLYQYTIFIQNEIITLKCGCHITKRLWQIPKKPLKLVRENRENAEKAKKLLDEVISTSHELDKYLSMRK
jgi:hypothetical protein